MLFFFIVVVLFNSYMLSVSDLSAN